MYISAYGGEWVKVTSSTTGLFQPRNKHINIVQDRVSLDLKQDPWRYFYFFIIFLIPRGLTASSRKKTLNDSTD